MDDAQSRPHKRQTPNDRPSSSSMSGGLPALPPEFRSSSSSGPSPKSVAPTLSRRPSSSSTSTVRLTSQKGEKKPEASFDPDPALLAKLHISPNRDYVQALGDTLSSLLDRTLDLIKQVSGEAIDLARRHEIRWKKVVSDKPDDEGAQTKIEAEEALSKHVEYFQGRLEKLYADRDRMTSQIEAIEEHEYWQLIEVCRQASNAGRADTLTSKLILRFDRMTRSWRTSSQRSTRSR